jgi:hypothetical protein
MALDEKQQKVQDKLVSNATKSAQKSAQDQLKAEIDRVKASDLSKPEQKAAIAALKNVSAGLKSLVS